jgi:hypothetical protein
MMFTKAGFRRDYKCLGHARVGMLGGRGIADGVLLQWPNGETAWGSRTRIVWPDQVVICGTDMEKLKQLRALAGGGNTQVLKV